MFDVHHKSSGFSCPHCDDECRGITFLSEEDADCFRRFHEGYYRVFAEFCCRSCHETFWFHVDRESQEKYMEILSLTEGGRKHE